MVLAENPKRPAGQDWQDWRDCYFNPPEKEIPLIENGLGGVVTDAIGVLYEFGKTHCYREAQQVLVFAEGIHAGNYRKKSDSEVSLSILFSRGNGRSNRPHSLRFKHPDLADISTEGIDLLAAPAKGLWLINVKTKEEINNSSERREVVELLDRTLRQPLSFEVGSLIEVRSWPLPGPPTWAFSGGTTFDISLLDWIRGCRPNTVASYQEALRKILGQEVAVSLVPVRATKALWRIDDGIKRRVTFSPSINEQEDEEREIALGIPGRKSSLIFRSRHFSGGARLAALRWEINPATEVKLRLIDLSLRHEEDYCCNVEIYHNGYEYPVLSILETRDSLGLFSSENLFNGGFVLKKNEEIFNPVWADDFMSCWVNKDKNSYNANTTPVSEITPQQIGANLYLLQQQDGSSVFFLRSGKLAGQWLKVVIPKETGIPSAAWIRSALFDPVAFFKLIEFVEEEKIAQMVQGENPVIAVE